MDACLTLTSSQPVMGSEASRLGRCCSHRHRACHPCPCQPRTSVAKRPPERGGLAASWSLDLSGVPASDAHRRRNLVCCRFAAKLRRIIGALSQVPARSDFTIFSISSTGWFVSVLGISPITLFDTSWCISSRNSPKTPGGATMTIFSNRPLCAWR